MGALGPDKGHGGKFLLVPPGYKGDLPTEGYFVTPSRMNDSTFFIRGMVVNDDVEGAVALLKKARIYPYSERDSPKPNRFFDVSNITSYDKLKLNDDGSTDLYFGPKAPAGLESNWVDTNASKGWLAWFRFYGPTETFFSKTWQLSDFEPEK